MSFLIFLREAATNNGGKGGDNRGNRRRPFRRRGGQENREGSAGPQVNFRSDKTEKFRIPERPKWNPPQIPAATLPVPDCPLCGKPIHDIASAISDKGTGNAVHFDCILAKLTRESALEKGDFVSYIGGGRFGIVHFNNPGEPKKFTIKKILELENKDERPSWRSGITDQYSVT